MYPWLYPGHYALSTYSLLFLCTYVVGSINLTLSPRRYMGVGDVNEDMPGLRPR